MRLVFLAIVLAFPVIDLYVTARFARWTGVPMWFWLLCSAVAGLWLMRNERLEFRARTVAAMHGEHPLLRGLVDSGRKVLAAMLLILPGVLSRRARRAAAAAADQPARRLRPAAGDGRPRAIARQRDARRRVPARLAAVVDSRQRGRFRRARGAHLLAHPWLRPEPRRACASSRTRGASTDRKIGYFIRSISVGCGLRGARIGPQHHRRARDHHRHRQPLAHREAAREEARGTRRARASTRR